MAPHNPPAAVRLKSFEIGVAPGKKLVGIGGIVKLLFDAGRVLKSSGIVVAE